MNTRLCITYTDRPFFSSLVVHAAIVVGYPKNIKKEKKKFDSLVMSASLRSCFDVLTLKRDEAGSDTLTRG